jgi:hypothetical protein
VSSIDHTIDTMPARVREQRRALFPPVTAEEERAKAARKNRRRRIVRCPACKRSQWVGKPCAWCSLGLVDV